MAEEDLERQAREAEAQARTRSVFKSQVDEVVERRRLEGEQAAREARYERARLQAEERAAEARREAMEKANA